MLVPFTLILSQVIWSRLVGPLVVCTGNVGRTFDQPADGFVIRGNHTSLILHRNVPGCAPPGNTSRLVEYEVDPEALFNLTRTADAELRGRGANCPG